MEEKLDAILNETSNIKVCMDRIEEKLDSQGKKIDSQGKMLEEQGKKLDLQEKILEAHGKRIDSQSTHIAALDKKVDKIEIDLRMQIINVKDELMSKIDDAIDINIRQSNMLGMHFEKLYQESKNDREQLHQSVDILSNAIQFNKMEIEKLVAKC